MLLFFPFLCFLMIAFGLKRVPFMESWRERLLVSAVAMGALIVFSTEALSAASLLRSGVLMVLWVGVFFVLLIGLASQGWPGRKAAAPEKTPAGRAARNYPAAADIPVPPAAMSAAPMGLLEKCLLGTILMLLAITGGVACIAAPNTWDSMTYHLPRILHWLAHGSVAFYETGNFRQNYNPPAAEYFLLQAFALTGSDRFVNLLQWAFGIGAAVAVSLLTSYANKALAAQLFGALFFLTVPMVILQSTSTQVDLVFSFWVIGTVYFGIRAMETKQWLYVALVGVSVGMAVLSKGFLVAILIPFFLWFGARALLLDRFRGLLKMAAIMLVAALVFAGWAWRIQRAGPLPEATQSLMLRDHSMACIISNTVKNAASECLINCRPVADACAQGVAAIHRLLGLQFDDPRTTGGPISHMLLLTHYADEDYAGNLWHLVLVAVCVVWAFFLRGPHLRAYAVCVLLSAILFCAMVKWQPWINRFHVSLFVLAAPLAAAVLGRHRRAIVLVSGLLVVLSVPYLFANHTRPLVGARNILSVPRNEQYFWKSPWLAASYWNAVAFIGQNGCRDVGLILQFDDWEYPLWALTRDDKIRFRHVMVRNGVAAMPEQGWPGLIVKIGPGTVTAEGASLTPLWRDGAIEILRPTTGNGAGEHAK